jgi:hypothetical protein
MDRDMVGIAILVGIIATMLIALMGYTTELDHEYRMAEIAARCPPVDARAE